MKNNSSKSSGSNMKQNKNTGNKKVDINARNEKAKYSDDEIAKKRHVDSIAKLIVRDSIANENIDTRNKWIDIDNLEVKDRWDNNGNYNPEILSYDVVLFDRIEQPEYNEWMTDDEKHQLTYEVAEGDIQKQKDKEKRSRRKKSRPSFHVDVSSKHIKGGKTKFQVKNIKRKK